MGEPLPPAPGLEPPAWPDLVAAFAAAYGVQPVAFTPVASAYHSPAALQVRWSGGAVCLKPFRGGHRRLERVEGYLHRLSTIAPRFWVAGRPGRTGRCAFFHRGRPFLVTCWEEGTPCTAGADQAGAAVAGTEGAIAAGPEAAAAAGRALAAFHRAGAGLAPWIPSHSWPRRWQRLLAEIAHAPEGLRLAAADPGDSLAELFRKAAAPPLATGRRAVSVLSSGSDYPLLERASRRRAQLCHRDLTPPNLLQIPTGQMLLLDPDTWGPDLRLADLSALVGPVSGFSAAAALRALAAYVEIAGPLHPAEVRLLPWTLRLPRELGWLCRQLHVNAADWPDRIEAALAVWRKRLALARTLEQELPLTKKTPG